MCTISVYTECVIHDRIAFKYSMVCIGVKATVAFVIFLMSLCNMLAHVPFPANLLTTLSVVLLIAKHWCSLL